MLVICNFVVVGEGDNNYYFLLSIIGEVVMKKVIMLILATMLFNACTVLDMSRAHRQEKKELRMETREKIRPIEEEYNKELKKVKTRQSLEFGVLVAKKIKALKELLK